MHNTAENWSMFLHLQSSDFHYQSQPKETGSSVLLHQVDEFLVSLISIIPCR